MTIGSNIPQSNPLGDSGGDSGLTTNTAFGKVTTGGQNANVDQNEKAQGVKGVAQNEKGNVGETSTIKAANLSADTPPPPDPETPEIAATKEFKPISKVNPWLTSFFLATLTANFAEIAKLGKDIHKAEAQSTVLMMQKVWQMAVDTGELIMAKAEKEANMHLALAISAMVGLAVSLAGTLLSIGGGFKVSGAKSQKAGLKGASDTPDAPTGVNEVKAGANPVAPRVAPKPLPKRPVANADVPDQPPVQQLNQPQPRPINQGPQQQPPVNLNAQNNPQPVPNQPVNAGAVNQPAAANPNQAGGTGNASNAQPDNASAPRSAGEKKADDPKSTAQKIIEEKNVGKTMQVAGSGMQAAANSVREMIDNIIQMLFKPDIAEDERDIEVKRAQKELASKALDSAIQAFNGGTDIVDGVVRAMESLSASIKAFSIGTRN